MFKILDSIVKNYKNASFGLSLAGKKTITHEISFCNGKFEKEVYLEDFGVLIEVSKYGKVFRKGLPLIHAGLIEEQIKLGVSFLEENHVHFLDNSSYQLSNQNVVEKNVSNHFSKNESKKIEDFFRELTQINQQYIDSVRAILINVLEERFIVNNIGGIFHDENNFIDYSFNLIGEKNGIVQNRSNGGEVFKNTLDENFFINATLGKEVLQAELMELLEAKVCPTFVGDLILPSDQMYIQIHESIGHPLELDRILGDERNYAGGSFVKKDDFGKLRYGPEIMNVTFGPDVEYMPATQSFDDTGQLTKPIYLIKGGILQAGIGGIESQTRLGVKGSMSTRNTNWNRPPIDRMGNINLDPGTSSIEEMIKNTENGIFMKTNNSWSIDDKRDKFQFGCEYAQLIKDGELTEVVRAPSYEGRTISFWNSLKMVGNSDSMKPFGTSNCGKGEPNQIIRVGHRSPTCLFENISIFGGE